MKILDIVHKIARLRHPVKHYTCFAIARFICLFLQIKTNKFFCISMNGNGYGCNVKAFADYAKNFVGENNVVWAFSPTYFKRIDITQKVQIYSIAYYVQLMTSRVIVSNQRFTKQLLPVKKNNQFYIQFWHGTALKRIEADIPDLPNPYKKRAVWDSSLIDVFFSGSSFMSSIYRSSFWYKGPVVEIGTPRNDVFFANNESLREKVFSSLGISLRKKIVLYAPTFRSNLSLEGYQFNSELFISLLQKKLGGEWLLVVRLHPNLLNKKRSIEKIRQMYPNAVDGSTYFDMQELLAVSDCLLTDYSSSMFDYACTKNPCFLYTPDMNEYDRGFYDITKNNLPFPCFTDEKSMSVTIESFEYQEYKDRVEEYLKLIGNKEDGHAAKSAFQYVQEKLGF